MIYSYFTYINDYINNTSNKKLLIKFIKKEIKKCKKYYTNNRENKLNFLTLKLYNMI